MRSLEVTHDSCHVNHQRRPLTPSGHVPRALMRVEKRKHLERACAEARIACACCARLSALGSAKHDAGMAIDMSNTARQDEATPARAPIAALKCMTVALYNAGASNGIDAGPDSRSVPDSSLPLSLARRTPDTARLMLLFVCQALQEVDTVEFGYGTRGDAISSVTRTSRGLLHLCVQWLLTISRSLLPCPLLRCCSPFHVPRSATSNKRPPHHHPQPPASFAARVTTLVRTPSAIHIASPTQVSLLA
jgi:hypothetical protein